MPMVNPFDVFTVSEISDTVNRIPNNYGRLNQLGLLPVKGVTTPTVAIEEWNGTLSLIPTERVRGPGQVGKVGKRKLRTFSIPKLVYDEFCGPEEVAGVRQFGGSEQDNLARLLNEKLATARAKHDITLEHLRYGAMKGLILDADGSTLYDLYAEFGVVQKTVDFLLGTATTNVRAKCYEVVRHIEDNLLGDVSSGVLARVSPEWFDKFIDHAKVKEAYANYQEAAQRLGGDVRKGFTFGGITYEEDRAIVSGLDANGAPTPRRFIAANEGHAFPLGTQDSFATYVGPADFNETVGQIGQLYYAKTQEAKFGRGWDVHTQSNPLPLCRRPAVLVKITTSN